jgi:hypothetical protein
VNGVNDAATAYVQDPTLGGLNALQVALDEGSNAFSQDVVDCEPTSVAAQFLADSTQALAEFVIDVSGSLNRTLANATQPVAVVNELLVMTGTGIAGILATGFSAVNLTVEFVREFAVEMPEELAESIARLRDSVGGSDVGGLAAEEAQEQVQVFFHVQSDDGPLEGALLVVGRDGAEIGRGRTTNDGNVSFALNPETVYQYEASAPGFANHTGTFQTKPSGSEEEILVTLEPATTEVFSARLDPLGVGVLLAGLVVAIYLLRRRR